MWGCARLALLPCMSSSGCLSGFLVLVSFCLLDLTRPVPCLFFFFQAEDGIRDTSVTGVQTCALPIFFRQEQDTGDRVLRTCRPRRICLRLLSLSPGVREPSLCFSGLRQRRHKRGWPSISVRQGRM